MNRKTSIIIIDPKDNVGVARERIEKGAEVTVREADSFSALDEIPAGHKIALKNIPAGSAVIKYGEIIGKAKEDILQGSWVHTHNMM
ncbi:MAG: UxaA family hydrolase [Syntrophales bacterium]|nr:UxaA family hydrolase [Syntrophales bacterium]